MVREQDKRILRVIIIGVIIGILASGVLFIKHMKAHQDDQKVFVGGQAVSVVIAEDEPARQQGLSGADPLGEHEGMLFVFDEPDTHGIWMKDMKFSLDIIWLDEDKRIVHIEERVSPETYPKSFAPKTPAKYVLELPEGYVEANKIAIGTTVFF